MKRATIILAGLFALLPTFLLAQSSPVVTNEEIPVNAVLPPTPCIAEFVAYTGTLSLETSTWIDQNGSTHLQTRERSMQVVGIGVTTGGTYRLMESTRIQSITSQDFFPFEVTNVLDHKVIGLGLLPNEKVTTFVHQVVDANGNTKTEVDNITSTCK